MSSHIIKIEWVQHEGLKAHDARRLFTGADVARGVNGIGKTTILDTIRLVITGSTLGIKKTNQDVMSLARPGVDRIRLLLAGLRADGRQVVIERRWTRGKRGAVEESIRIDGAELGARDGEAEIRALFPGLDEVWEPAAIFRETPAAMRARLLALVPPTAIKLEDVVPGDVPKWALPRHTDMGAVAWASFAIEQTDARINKAAADRREEEAVLRRLVDTTEVEASTDVDTTEIEATLAALREELTGCSVSRVARAAAERTEAQALARLEAARRAVGAESQIPHAEALERVLVDCLPAGAKVRVATAVPSGNLAMVVRAAAAEIRAGLARVLREAPALERRRAEAAKVLERVRAFPASTWEAHAATKAAFDEVASRARPVEEQLAGLRGELRALSATTAEPVLSDPLSKALAGWRALSIERRGHVHSYLTVEAQNRTGDTVFHDAAARAAMLLEAAALAPAEDAAREARRAEVQGRIEALEIDVDLLHAEREEAADLVMRAEAGAKRADAERELAEVGAELAAIELARPRIPAEVKQPETWLHGIESRVAEIFAAETSAAKAREALADLEAAHEAAMAALAAMPEGRAREDVEAEIADAEKRLDAAKAHNVNAVKVREALATLRTREANEEALKNWRARFVEIQTDLVDRSRAWFEQRYSELLGGVKVEVKLSSATDKPDCRILVDGIEVRTMCPGHQAFALVMFLLLVSGAKKGGFRFLPIDELERIAKENREAFLRALQDAKAAGQIDQWIATGCPDSVPTIEGVTVHDMGQSAELIPEEREDDDAPIPEPTEAPRRRTRRGSSAAYDAA